jgi:hypothetical protein
MDLRQGSYLPKPQGTDSQSIQELAMTRLEITAPLKAGFSVLI